MRQAERDTLHGTLKTFGMELTSVHRFGSDKPVDVALRLSAVGIGSERQVQIALGCGSFEHEGFVKPFAFARIVHALNSLGPFLRTLTGGTYDVRLDLSDEGSPSAICMDRPSGGDWLLMPDLYSLQAASNGWNDLDRKDARDEYLAREPKLFWRGATTGLVVSRKQDITKNIRIRACMICRDEIPELSDCKISAIVQSPVGDAFNLAATLEFEGLLAGSVPEAEFLRYRLYMDLSGNTSAWGVILKALGGCTLLRPDGSRETLFSSQLQPWEHYVPLRADLSDLAEKTRLMLAEPVLAEFISWNARQLASRFLRSIPMVIDSTFAWFTASSESMFPVDETHENP